MGNPTVTILRHPLEVNKQKLLCAVILLSGAKSSEIVSIVHVSDITEDDPMLAAQYVDDWRKWANAEHFAWEDPEWLKKTLKKDAERRLFADFYEDFDREDTERLVKHYIDNGLVIYVDGRYQFATSAFATIEVKMHILRMLTE